MKEDTRLQMAQNVAGLLCYLLGWISGLILFLIDKRPYARFHAEQWIVVFGGCNILTSLLGIVFGFNFMAGGVAGLSRGYAIYQIFDLVMIVLWILLMIKAYQGERFRLPIAADLVDKIFGKA